MTTETIFLHSACKLWLLLPTQQQRRRSCRISTANRTSQHRDIWNSSFSVDARPSRTDV